VLSSGLCWFFCLSLIHNWSYGALTPTVRACQKSYCSSSQELLLGNPANWEWSRKKGQPVQQKLKILAAAAVAGGGVTLKRKDQVSD